MTEASCTQRISADTRQRTASSPSCCVELVTVATAFLALTTETATNETITHCRKKTLGRPHVFADDVRASYACLLVEAASRLLSCPAYLGVAVEHDALFIFPFSKYPLGFCILPLNCPAQALFVILF